ncbi:hypothetical protein D1872_266260 [compost metagenome]
MLPAAATCLGSEDQGDDPVVWGVLVQKSGASAGDTQKYQSCAGIDQRNMGARGEEGGQQLIK